MDFQIINTRIENIKADAAVIPTNVLLIEGVEGTISYTIFEKAGSEKLRKECELILEKERGYINNGRAIPTHAFDYNSKCLIHAVVPMWIDGNHNEFEELSQAYVSSLTLADFLQCESIVFPLMSSGYNRFDKELATQIALECIKVYEAKFLKSVYLAVTDNKAIQYLRNEGYQVIDLPIAIDINDPHNLKNGGIENLIEYRAKKESAEFVDSLVDKGFAEAKKPENWARVIKLALLGLEVARKVVLGI